METPTKKPTILVIEDEETLLNVIADSLESAGFEVVKARIADQAIQYLKDIDAIDLIWLDHYLLGDDGIIFTKKIKADEAFKKIPIFVISNSEDLEKKKQYLELGAVKYYTKADNSLEKIIGEIKKYLNL